MVLILLPIYCILKKSNLNTDMNNHINKLLGIFIGAIIGAMIGYHLIDYSIYLMFIAPFIGGLSASLIIAPKTTTDIIKKSFVVTFMETPSKIRDWVSENKDLFEDLFKLIIYILFYESIIICFAGIIAYVFGIFVPTDVNNRLNGTPTGILAGFLSIYLLILSSIFITGINNISKENFFENLHLLLLYANPLIWPFWVLYFTFKGIKHLITNHQKYIRATVGASIYCLKFTARFSIRCESGLRKHGLMLSIISAAIGSFCGQFYSQSLYGGLIGIGSYVVIHTSVWIISIIPRNLPSQILR